MGDLLEDYTWLFRGVPYESEEREDVAAIGEVRPPRAERVGADWVQQHQAGYTITGYTSWTTDRDIAVHFAQEKAKECNLSGRTVIFRVRIRRLPKKKIFQGRDDEDEFLIEGTVERVEFSEGDEDE